ncbi:MAG: zinc-ribbon domain-containing protein [Alphaproteobacteria bacterium]
MIINCKKCSTKYVVPDSSIGVNGRNVKCAKCGYVWIETLSQEINSATPDVAAAAISDPSLKYSPIAASSLPALINKKPPVILFISPLILIILTIFSILFLYNHNLIKFFPNSIKFLSHFKIENVDELKIENVRFDKNFYENQTDINLTYDILNSSSTKKNILEVKIRVLDENNKELASFNSKGKIPLNPSETQSVSNKLSNVPKEATNISLELKNKFTNVL